MEQHWKQRWMELKKFLGAEMENPDIDDVEHATYRRIINTMDYDEELNPEPKSK